MAQRDPQSYISIRVKLLWAWQLSAPFQGLSRNIVREICSFYSFIPDILVIGHNEVWAFRVDTKAWKPFIVKRSALGSLIASVFVAENKAFLVLTNKTSAMYDIPYYAMCENGHIRKYGFEINRFSCAVAYNHCQNCVYIFGGYHLSLRGTQPAKLSHKFPLDTCKTAELPDMLVGRCHFALCWHLGLLYLCAGSHPSVHTFNPITLAHSAICDLEIAGEYCLAVSYQADLLVLSKECVYRWKAGKWTVQRRQVEPEDIYAPAGAAVLLGSCLYYSDLRCCYAVNLDTEKIEKYPLECRRKKTFAEG